MVCLKSQKESDVIDMVFAKNQELSLADFARFANVDLPEKDTVFRGLDKVERRLYRAPILTYALSENYFRKALADPWAVAIVVSPDVIANVSKKELALKPLLVVNDPVSIFFGTHNKLALEASVYQRSGQRPRISSRARIHPSAEIEAGVSIAENVVVGARVVIKTGSRIGKNTRILDGAIIGTDALEVKKIDGSLTQIVHVGGVRIGQGCTISASAVVSRNIFHGDTVIGEETSVGEFSHISHGVHIGPRCFLAAGVLTGGHSTVGHDSFIGMGVTIRQLATVGPDSHVSMGSVVVSSTSRGSKVSGVYARDSKRWAAEQHALSRLSGGRSRNE